MRCRLFADSHRGKTAYISRAGPGKKAHLADLENSARILAFRGASPARRGPEFAALRNAVKDDDA